MTIGIQVALRGYMQVKSSGTMEGVWEVEWDGDVETNSEETLSMMCWNVCGWCRDGGGWEQIREGHDIRAEVVDFYRPDVVALVETWLMGDEEIVVEGYQWFGRKRGSYKERQWRGGVELGCWCLGMF